jgi:hypothetical protein
MRQIFVQPGDSLEEPIDAFGIINHMKVFATDENGNLVIVENQKGVGTHITPVEGIQYIKPGTVVIPFQGTEQQRQGIFNRARAVEGSPYDLLQNNCEHVANFIKHENPTSPTLGKALLVSVGLYFLFRNN